MTPKREEKKTFFILCMIFLIGFFLISLIGAVHFTFAAQKPTKASRPASPKDPSQAPATFADLVDKLKPAVVNIATTQVMRSGIGGQVSPFEDEFMERFFGGEDMLRRFFGDSPRQFKQQSLGSGFLITRDGYILTNNHVIEKANKITVRLSSGKEYDATVIGRDAKTDLALIKINSAGNLPIVEFGNSDKLRVGDWVVAIGNPFGLEQTVTAGIVSAKGRVIGAGPYDNFIQTDASINPGNSGGPLFSTDGKVVGINTAIVAHGQGIGFAIPINMATDILSDLKTKGKVSRGWLGISVQDLTEDMAENLRTKGKEGALVADVMAGDPADKAGLKIGDIITAIDGKKVKDTHDLLMIVASIPIGKKVEIQALRDGKSSIFHVLVAERKDAEEVARKSNVPGGYYGMTVSEITAEIAEYLGLSDKTGVVVTAVRTGSPADTAGVRPQDIILQVNKARVSSLKVFRQEMSKKGAMEKVLLLVKRGHSTRYIPLSKQ